MMTTSELSALFEPREAINGFDTVEAELEAVRSKAKAMSVFTFSLSSLDDQHFKRLLKLAFDLHLTVIQQVEHISREGHTYEQIYTFVLQSTDAWRVPAYMLTRKALRSYPWSDGAEFIESSLLGYSANEIESWMKRLKATQLSWTGKTFYLLMSHKQQELIAQTGMRCIEPQTLLEPITAFYSRTKAVIKSDVYDLIQKNQIIGRVSVKESMFRLLFGNASADDNPDVVSALITPDVARSLNPALDSNFQFLQTGGWR
jgi:hypothetical protein